MADPVPQKDAPTIQPVDFQRISSNIARMKADGASPEDVAQYMSITGVDQSLLNASGFGEPRVSTGKALAGGFEQGASMGFGDEIGGAIGATIGRPGGGAVQGDTWSDRYTNARDEIRSGQHAAQAQHPVAYGAGQIAGAVVPAVLAPEAFGTDYVAAAPTLRAAAARGALTSGAYGAVTGLGGAEGSAGQQALQTAESAGAGALIGAPLGAASRAIAGVRPPAAPSSQIAHDAGTAAYQGANLPAVALEPGSIQRLAQTIHTDMTQFGLRPKLQPLAHGVLDDVDAIANNPNPTMQDVELLRRIAGRAFNPTNPSEGEAGGRIIGHIDDFMDNLQPHDVTAGNGPQAVANLQSARAHWSAYRKSDLVETAITRAQDRAASTGTGGNVVNAIRQNLRQILDNPKKSRGFTDDELDAIRAVVHGGAGANLARLASVFAPSRGGLNAWAGTAMAAIPGIGPVIPAAGEAAHRAAQNMTLNAANRLPEMIRTGVPGAIARAPVPPYSQALAQALGASQNGSNAYANALLQPTGASQ